MIELRNLNKTFHTRDGALTALDDINLTVQDGEIFGIIGLSGAGKSTLVRCMNLLERPTHGEVLVDGQDLMKLSPAGLREVRRNIGMIFQSYNLLEQRTVLRNVLYPLELTHEDRRTARTRAMQLLDLVGLADRASAYPAQLSGGQKQRVAIARALATNPHYLLCDEATSALDPTTTDSILALLQTINRTLGVTVVVITHEMAVVDRICHRVAVIDNSRIVEMGAVDDIRKPAFRHCAGADPAARQGGGNRPGRGARPARLQRGVYLQAAGVGADPGNRRPGQHPVCGHA